MAGQRGTNLSTQALGERLSFMSAPVSFCSYFAVVNTRTRVMHHALAVYSISPPVYGQCMSRFPILLYVQHACNGEIFLCMHVLLHIICV